MEKKNEWLIELSREDIWAKNLDSLPSMICHAYNQLKALTENGQVYGVMLQCKDLYESLLKVPLIMALIVIESTPANKDKDEYREIIKKTLKDPLSIGGWYKLSTAMTDEDADVGIPDTLCEILVQTEKLYEKRVSPVYQNIAHWRNNAIGHGALKFEDDEYYRIEIRNLLTNVKEYFENDGERTIPQLYESAYFFCGETKLTGKQHYPSEPKESIKLSLNNQVYDVEHYITDNELKIYLFDSFYSSRKQIKYSSYIDGHEEMGKDPFFIDLYDRFVVKGIKDFDYCGVFPFDCY